MDESWKHYAKKISQTQKDKYSHSMIPLNEISRIDKFIKTEGGIEVTRARRGGNRKLLLSGYGVSVWGDERVLEIIVVMVTQHCECT